MLLICLFTFLVSVYSQCTNTCPVNNYLDSGCVCQPCTSGCINCYGPGLDSCSACVNTTGGSPQSYYKVIGRDTCTTECGNLYYEAGSTNTC
jgi:hypothetical protein